MSRSTPCPKVCTFPVLGLEVFSWKLHFLRLARRSVIYTPVIALTCTGWRNRDQTVPMDGMNGLSLGHFSTLVMSFSGLILVLFLLCEVALALWPCASAGSKLTEAYVLLVTCVVTFYLFSKIAGVEQLFLSPLGPALLSLVTVQLLYQLGVAISRSTEQVRTGPGSEVTMRAKVCTC